MQKKKMKNCEYEDKSLNHKACLRFDPSSFDKEKCLWLVKMWINGGNVCRVPPKKEGDQ